MPLPILTGSKVRLRPKRLHDAVTDFQWRKDAELCRLDATEPTTSSFEEYLRLAAVAPSGGNGSGHFAIETFDGNHIGNCSYFNVSEAKNEAEIGIMIGNKAYWEQGYGTDAMHTMLSYIFSHTALSRIYLKTLSWNTRAQKCFWKCGFTPCGQLSRDGFNFILMEIHRPQQVQGWFTE
jgi:RimJ/RimL family protein N-acetyltransferase